MISLITVRFSIWPISEIVIYELIALWNIFQDAITDHQLKSTLSYQQIRRFSWMYIVQKQIEAWGSMLRRTSKNIIQIQQIRALLQVLLGQNTNRIIETADGPEWIVV